MSPVFKLCMVFSHRYCVKKQALNNNFRKGQTKVDTILRGSSTKVLPLFWLVIGVIVSFIFPQFYLTGIIYPILSRKKWMIITLVISIKNAPTNGTTRNALCDPPNLLVIAVMLAIAVGVAPKPRPI